MRPWYRNSAKGVGVTMLLALLILFGLFAFGKRTEPPPGCVMIGGAIELGGVCPRSAPPQNDRTRD